MFRVFAVFVILSFATSVHATDCEEALSPASRAFFDFFRLESGNQVEHSAEIVVIGTRHSIKLKGKHVFSSEDVRKEIEIRNAFLNDRVQPGDVVLIEGIREFPEGPKEQVDYASVRADLSLRPWDNPQLISPSQKIGAFLLSTQERLLGNPNRDNHLDFLITLVTSREYLVDVRNQSLLKAAYGAWSGEPRRKIWIFAGTAHVVKESGLGRQLTESGFPFRIFVPRGSADSTAVSMARAKKELKERHGVDWSTEKEAMKLAMLSGAGVDPDLLGRLIVNEVAGVRFALRRAQALAPDLK